MESWMQTYNVMWLTDIQGVYGKVHNPETDSPFERRSKLKFPSQHCSKIIQLEAVQVSQGESETLYT